MRAQVIASQFMRTNSEVVSLSLAKAWLLWSGELSVLRAATEAIWAHDCDGERGGRGGMSPLAMAREGGSSRLAKATRSEGLT